MNEPRLTMVVAPYEGMPPGCVGRLVETIEREDIAPGIIAETRRHPFDDWTEIGLLVDG